MALICRIDEMRLGVRLSIMRDTVENAGVTKVLFVVHFLASTMTELGWDGHGWLTEVPTPSTPSLKIAECVMINTLMIIGDDWGDDEIGALLPLLSNNTQSVRRAAWVVFRCWNWNRKILSLNVSLAITAGLSDTDSVVRSHAEEMVAGLKLRTKWWTVRPWLLAALALAFMIGVACGSAMIFVALHPSPPARPNESD